MKHLGIPDLPNGVFFGRESLNLLEERLQTVEVVEPAVLLKLVHGSYDVDGHVVPQLGLGGSIPHLPRVQHCFRHLGKALVERPSCTQVASTGDLELEFSPDIPRKSVLVIYEE